MWLIGGIALLTAFLLSLSGTWCMRAMAPRVGLIDHPSERKVHAAATPLGGGVAIWAAVVLTVLLAYLAAAAVYSDVAGRYAWFPESVRKYLPGMLSRGSLVGLVLGLGTIVMLMGLVDDRRGLSYVLRLAIEVILVLLLISQGVRMTLFAPLSNFYVSSAITVAWVVGLTN